MTATEIVAARPISEVFVALGGNLLKRGRARAFWRDGDNPQAVSLNDSKGCWFDHRDGIGGGVLDLVQHVLGCDRADALRRLSEINGVPLNDGPFTAAERRQYARMRQEAAELIQWKERMLSALRAERTRWWRIHHAARMHVLEHGLDSPLGDLMAAMYEVSEDLIEKLNRDVDTLATAPHADLLPIFQDQKRKVAA